MSTGTVKSIALGRIRSHKVRSAVVCVSVLLTAILFMTVISISVNLISAYTTTLLLEKGSDYHAIIMAEDTGLSDGKIRDAVDGFDGVKESVFFAGCPVYSLDEDGAERSTRQMAAIENEEALPHFFTEIIDGSFPSDESEIMLSRAYYPDINTGDTVRVYYVKPGANGSAGRVESAEFRVSGLFDCAVSGPHLTLIMRYNNYVAENYSVRRQIFLNYNSVIGIAGKGERLNSYLLDICGFSEGGLVDTNPVYLSSSLKNILNPATVFAVLFSLTVVFVCAFLLIYNIYSIALTHDMQSLGLLRVIGMTEAQTRKMTFIESSCLYAFSMPLGLLLGYFIGHSVLSPLFLSLAYSEPKTVFSPVIPIFTAVFTYAVLVFSAAGPLGRLKKLSPVESLDYSPSTELPKKFRRRKNHAKRHRAPTPAYLAKNSIRSEKKKNTISALSVSIAVILFVLVSTSVDYMTEYRMLTLQKTDFRLTPHRTEENLYGTGNIISSSGYGLMEEGFCIDGSITEYLDSSPLAESYDCLRYTALTLETTERAKSGLLEYFKVNKHADQFTYLRNAYSGELYTIVIGVPDRYFGSLRINDEGDTLKDLFTEKELEEKFFSGEYVVYDSSMTEYMTDSEGNPFEFSYYNDGDKIRISGHDYTAFSSSYLFPLLRDFGYGHASAYSAVMYLPESVFLESIGEGLIHTIMLDAKDGCEEALRDELESIGNNYVGYNEEIFTHYTDEFTETFVGARCNFIDFNMNVNGRLDGYEREQKQISALNTVGTSLAGIVFLIGIINVVSTALSSADEKKRVYAMLEAVGMTEKQLRHTIFTECLYSGVISSAIVLLVGFPAIWLITEYAMDSIVSLSFVPGLVMLALSVGVSVLSSLLMLKSLSKSPVTERLKYE